VTRPGWYPNPRGGGKQQWWDGAQWTNNVHDPAPKPVTTWWDPYGRWHAQPPDTREVIAVVPKRTNHALHLLLTLLTFWFFGGWLWVWILVAIDNHGKTQKIYK